MSERFLFTWRNAFREHGPDGLTTRAVGLALSMYADTAQGVARPKQSRLAGDLGCARNTINIHLEKLVDQGWVQKQRKRYGCTYYLTVPESVQMSSSRDANETGCSSHERQMSSSETSDVIEPNKSDGQMSSSRDANEAGCSSHERQMSSSVDSDVHEDGLHDVSQGTHKELTEAAASGTDEPEPARESFDPTYDDIWQIDDPEHFVAQIASFYDVEINSPSAVWSQVRRSAGFEVDADRLKTFLDVKLSDLAADETDYTPRAIQRFLREDVTEWLEQKAKRAVGRNPYDDTPDDHETRHEDDEPESPKPTDPPQTSTSSDWPPEGYEHPSRWKTALEELRGQMAPEAYGHWIEPIAVAQLDGRRAELVVKEAFQAEWIGGKYADLIREALDVDDLTIRTPQLQEAS